MTPSPMVSWSFKLEPYIIKIKDVCSDRVFSAQGANLLFDHIFKIFENGELSQNRELHIDFDKIPLVSTSFIGRFLEQLTLSKTKFNFSKIRLLNLKSEIKRQFQKTDS